MVGDLSEMVAAMMEEQQTKRIAEMIEAEAWKGLNDEERGLVRGIAGKVSEVAVLLAEAREKLGVERFTYLCLGLIHEGRQKEETVCGLNGCLDECLTSQVGRISIAHLSDGDKEIGEGVAKGIFDRVMEPVS